MEPIEQMIREHPFFAGLADGFFPSLTACAEMMAFGAGEYLFHEGEPAGRFHLLRHGRVALQSHRPGQGATTLQTLGDGEIVGVSWLAPPFRWSYDAKATAVTRAVTLDTARLRQAMEEDHELGYELMRRLVPVLIARLHATHLQSLDVYGARG